MKKFVTCSLVAASLFLAALQTYAQADAQQRRGGFGILTEEQRTKMRESMQASQAELTALNEKLAAAQKEAVTAAMAKTPDEKAVRAKVEAVNKIQTDIAMLRLKGFKEVAGTLTEEQKTQINERPGVAYNMFLGGFGGMGMGGRGPGAGGGARRGGGNQ